MEYKPIAERFWDKVGRRGQPDDCWLWAASRDEGGYGRIRRERSRYLEAAHRISFELNVGHIPEGLHVLHQCDNPPCVNPAHLVLGSHQDNMADRGLKGRTEVGRGERHAFSTLTEAEVLEILSSKEPHSVVAPRYGIHPTTVSRIRKGQAWRHLTKAHTWSKETAGSEVA